MPIPPFTIDGILPPFLGQEPGGPAAMMSPYQVSVTEVVARFGTTDDRKAILNNWLDHRDKMREIGITKGFQWLDGSFLENKDPDDLDIITFLHRPDAAKDIVSWNTIMVSNKGVLSRKGAKTTYRLDAFFIDLDGTIRSAISTSRYYLQLFSHQRKTFLWKGMLEVQMGDSTDEASARTLLTPPHERTPNGGQP